MKHFAKVLSLALALAMLMSLCIVSPVAADAGKHLLREFHSTCNGDDGGWWAADDTCAAEANGAEGLTVTCSWRMIWGFNNSVIDSMPYLIFELEDGVENFDKITISKYFSDQSKNIEHEILPADFHDNIVCVNAQEIMKDDETIGYNYVALYQHGEVKYSKIYFSDTDLEGNVYVKPTQPPVPVYDPATEIRYNLAVSATADDVNGILFGENEESIFYRHLDLNLIEDGNGGFTLQHQEGAAGTFANLAWVVPYEQLEKTPYLVLEVENEGRPDEGPRTYVYAYWEGVVGSGAYFDDIGASSVGANGLNGVNRWPLKYAIDNVKESLHGENGIAIILGLEIDRADGTTFDPLKVKSAYLLGYTEGAETYKSTTTTVPGGSDKGDDKGDDGEGSFPWVPVACGAAAVIVIAVVAAVIVAKKKK